MAGVNFQAPLFILFLTLFLFSNFVTKYFCLEDDTDISIASFSIKLPAIIDAGEETFCQRLATGHVQPCWIRNQKPAFCVVFFSFVVILTSTLDLFRSVHVEYVRSLLSQTNVESNVIREILGSMQNVWK